MAGDKRQQQDLSLILGELKRGASSPGPVWHTWDGNLEVSRKWAERPQDGQAGRSEVAVSLRTC